MMRQENGSTQALLFTDKDKASIEARRILSESDVSFTELNTSNLNSANSTIHPPTLISREGDFAGLEGIKEFIAIVSNRPKTA